MRKWIVRTIIATTLATSPVAGTTGQYNETEAATVTNVAYEREVDSKCISRGNETVIDLSGVDAGDVEIELELSK